MVPSVSDALASMAIGFPALNVELFAGLVMLTEGGRLAAVTFMETVVDVVTTPLLSVAFAVSE